MKILNLLITGEIGGIEVLCKNIIEKSKQDHRICCLFKEGKIYNELKKSEAKVFSTVNEKQNLLKIEKIIYRYCKENNIDTIIIHHGSVKGNIIFLMLMKKLKNVKFVRYNHCCFNKYSEEKNLIKRFLSNMITKKALEKSDLNIYVSKASKKSFMDKLKLKDDKKNIVIYNGIPDRFLDTEIPKRQENITYITYVGRLEKCKGVNVFIDAFSKIVKNRKNLKLMIVGEGTELNNLKRMVQDKKIEKLTIFTGAKKDVIPELDKSKIFVYPSLWEEAGSISVIEALSRGCITIASNKGANPELIHNGKNGIITEKENLDKALEFALDMPEEKQKEMSENARNRAKELRVEYTIDKIENSIKNINKR